MHSQTFVRIVPACALLLGSLLLTGVVPARAGGMLIGTNLGFTHFAPEEGDGLSAFSLPYQTVFLGAFQPGLRIGGFADAARRHEVFVDTGLLFLSRDGLSLNSIQLMANYQRSFGDGPNAPFIGVGLGVLHLGDNDDSVNAMVIGGGLGVRHRLANGHGALRGELRVDHQFEGKDNGAVAMDAINAYGLKLGFDLYLD